MDTTSIRHTESSLGDTSSEPVAQRKHQISIRSKLLLTSVLPILGVLLLLIIALMQLKAANEGVNRIYNERVLPLQQLKSITDDYSLYITDAVNRANAGLLTAQQTLDSIQQGREQIQRKWQTYRTRPLGSTEQQLAEETEQLFEQADQAISKLEKTLTRLAEVSPKAASRLRKYDGPLYQVIDPIGEKVDELVQLQLQVVAQEKQQQAESFNQQLIILTAIAGFIITVLLVLSQIVYRSVKRPLHSLNQSMARIVENADLTAQVPVHRHDEIGQMAERFNQTLHSMRYLIQQIRQTSGKLAGAAQQLDQISHHSKDQLSGQSQEVEQVKVAMEQMQASAEEIARQADSANQEAQHTQQAAINGNQVVDDALQSTRQLVDSVQSVSAQIQTLATDSQDISTVVAEIAEIADQTNLLALNAAIESARAGEQGRGFAVVADEVRNLAQRTQHSTEQIQQAIQNLQQGTQHTASTMHGSNQQAQSAGQKASEAAHALQEIQAAIERMSHMNLHIASASEQQTRVTDEINRSLDTIYQLSQQTDSGASEVAQTSQTLSQVSSELEQLLAGYRI